MVQGADKVRYQAPSFTVGGNQYVTRSNGQTGINPIAPMVQPNYAQFDRELSPDVTGTHLGNKFDSNRWVSEFGY